MLATNSPFPQFFDLDGSPLDNGAIYYGTAGANPITSPLTVYWDKAGTQPASQPIATVNGYTARAGTPGAVYASSDYSILVRNRRGQTVYHCASASTLDNDISLNASISQVRTDLANAASAALGAGMVAYAQARAYASGTVGGKLIESVSVLDFGADPTGVADSTSAFVNAVATGKRVYAPAGTWKLNAASLPSNAYIYGDGMRRTILVPAAGATSVLLIDATSSARQNVVLRDLCFKNPANVAGCAAIWFKGTDVFSINDQHNLTNIEIGPSGWYGTSYKFATGIKTTGRLLTTTCVNVQIYACTKGWHSVTDPSTPAFNGQIFEQCVFAECEQQGFLHTGQATNVLFLGGYTQGNNTLAVAGVPGMEIEDLFNWELIGHGFEGNAPGLPVDTVNPLGGSVSLLIGGTICQNLIVRGGYFTASGANIVIKSSVSNMTGGRISENFLNCASGGFNFATLNAGPSNQAQIPLVFSATNQCNGQVSVYTGGVGQSACIEQSQGIAYLTTTATLDLLKISSIVTNPSVTMAITTINNRVPGCELEILNIYGTASVTIAAALMDSGALETITTGTKARFRVIGAPNAGKLVRV